MIALFLKSKPENMRTLSEDLYFKEILGPEEWAEAYERDPIDPNDPTTQLLLAVMRKNESDCKTLWLSGWMLPEAFLTSDYDEDGEGIGCDAINDLQDVLRDAAKDVAESQFYAVLQGKHIPSLHLLRRHYGVTSIHVETPVVILQDLQDPERHARPYCGADRRTCRVCYATGLIPPYRFVFGYMHDLAMQWLGDLSDPRCFTCGEEIDPDSQTNRQYCSERCRQAAARWRKKNDFVTEMSRSDMTPA